MNGDGGGDEKVIDLRKAIGLPSPSDVLDRPREYLPAEPPPPFEAAADLPGEPATAPPADDDGPAVAFEKLSLLPRPGDPYAAHARPIGQSLPMLVLLGRDGSRPSFAYHDLRFIDVLPAAGPGDGPGLLLRFAGIGDAELQGLRLDNLHGHLYLHRLAWIREAPAGLVIRDDHAIVITRITIRLAGKE